MSYPDAADHAEIYVPHSCPEHTVDLGEVRMNYAVAGDPGLPAMLLIPAQTESGWGYEAATRLTADRYHTCAVDPRGQGRSTWAPGRYSLDIVGGDLVPSSTGSGHRAARRGLRALVRRRDSGPVVRLRPATSPTPVRCTR